VWHWGFSKKTPSIAITIQLWYHNFSHFSIQLATKEYSVSTTQHHRCAVAQPYVNGNWLSQWKMAKFDPAHIQNPSTDRHKIWNKWLRPWDDQCARFRANPSIGGFSANGWNITKIFQVYIYLFCWPTYRSDRPADFHVRWLGQCGLTQGSNLFWELKFEVNIQPVKNPPNVKNWAQKRTCPFKIATFK